MEDIVITNKNPLCFIDETTAIERYSEGGLANQIFELADKQILDNQKTIFESIISVSPAVAELAKGMKKSETLKLVFSDEVKEKIANGTYKLMKRKDADGIFKAVVVDQKGKTKAIADLKWDELPNGMDPTGMANAMQGMAIQQQLNEIAEQLNDMTAAMDDILIGQHNDRLAMFFSGEAIYREALATSDSALKKSLTSSAILALTNATASLQTNLIHEIKTISEKYDADKGRFIGIKSTALKEKMEVINSSFQTIHKASTLKAAIYYKEGEYAAMTSVLTDYKSFLERSLPGDTAHILYLADPNEKTFEGVWNIRQNELPVKIEDTRKLLANTQEYALVMKKENLV